MKQLDILLAIRNERARQEDLKRAGKFKHSCADRELNSDQRLAILAEEFGEVAREVCELNLDLHPELTGQAVNERLRNLKKELTQTAAVCAAWLETLPEEL